MYDVILPLNIKWWNLVKSGKKKYDLRSRVWTYDCERCWIYVIKPIGKIMGYVNGSINNLTTGTIFHIWDNYKNKLCIPKKDYDKYCYGLPHVTVIPYKGLTEIDPIDPKDIFYPWSCQGFRYDYKQELWKHLMER